jgi:hypothetical protein
LAPHSLSKVFKEDGSFFELRLLIDFMADLDDYQLIKWIQAALVQSRYLNKISVICDVVTITSQSWRDRPDVIDETLGADAIGEISFHLKMESRKEKGKKVDTLVWEAEKGKDVGVTYG